jgi:hypothetical protein
LLAGDVLDDDRGFADDPVPVAEHRDRGRWPQLRQLGALEVTLLLKHVVFNAQLIESNQHILAIEREGGAHRESALRLLDRSAWP